MTGKPPVFTASGLSVAHGFFSREGGVSKGVYASLNGGVTTDDQPEDVHENRRLMASYFGVKEDHFLGLKQIHSRKVVTVRSETALWSLAASPEADGLVTDCPDIVLSVATADCAPMLLASDDGRIVGAAHAGWRGAVEGILEETVRGMQSLGARGVRAVIGPCIGPASYEVSSDMREQLLVSHKNGDVFFKALPQKGQFLFDLPRFCEALLRKSGVVGVENLALDTLSDQRFYSYRRSMLAGEAATGRQISAIQARLV